MKPTQEQLNDPKWWDENVSDEHDYAFTTGPEWAGADKYIGIVEFATKDGKQDDSRLAIRSDCWILLAKRPTKPVFVPEVGSQCEVTWGSIDNWNECMILPDNKIAILGNVNRIRKHCELYDIIFRPIKSEREQFMEKAMAVFKGDNMELYSVVAGALYDSGCRFVEVDK